MSELFGYGDNQRITDKRLLHYFISEDAKANGIKPGLSDVVKLFYGNIPARVFRFLKPELLYLRKFESIEQFLEEQEDYLEYYNTDRIKAKPNEMSSVQYRTQNHRS